ncbi:O-Antigen ligase [compost metagenome]
MTGLLIIILPSINDPQLVNSTITSKLIYLIYGITVIMVFYCFCIVFSKNSLISISKIDISLLTLILYIALNRYFIQPDQGFSLPYIELLVLSFLYVVLKNILYRNYSWILLCVVVSGIIQAINGYLQLFGFCSSNHSGFKMTGSFFNPGPYAGFLVSVWVIALGMFLFRTNIIKELQYPKNSFFLNKVTKCSFEYIPLIGIVSIAILLPVLQSRASWLASLLGSGVLLELKYHFLKNIFKKATVKAQKKCLVVLFIGLLIVGVSAALYHYKKASSDGRIFIWKVTTKIIADTPVFGVGFDQFKSHYMNYQAAYFAKYGETKEVVVADNTNYAFNEWLQFIAENGIFGFLLLFIVILILFQTKTKFSKTYEVFVAKTGLLTIGVFACLSYPMQILPIKIIIVILIAIVSICSAPSFQIKIGNDLKKQWIYKLSLIVLVFFATCQAYIYTKKLHNGFIVWNKALFRYQYGDYSRANKEFELAYPIFKKEGNFLMNYGKTLSMAEEHVKAIEVLELSKKYQNNTVIAIALGDSYKAIRYYHKAEVAYQQAINMIPSKFFASYLLAKLYDESGKEKKAVAIAKKLINKKIKISSSAIREMQEEMKTMLKKYKNPLGIKN